MPVPPSLSSVRLTARVGPWPRDTVGVVVDVAPDREHALVEVSEDTPGIDAAQFADRLIEVVPEQVEPVVPAHG